MRLFRSVVVCSAVTLVLGLAPSVAGPAFAAGALVASPATVPATAGQVLPLAALFQPIPRGSFPSFQYVNVVVTLSGGLTASDGGQTIAAQGPTALLTVLGIPVTAKSSGRATLRVTALDNNVPISDDATTTVDVPRPAPLPGEVRLLSTVGAAPAKVGQPLLISSLFKAVDVDKQFNLVKTTIDVTLTGGLVFAANGGQFTLGPQFTRVAVSTSVFPHAKTMNDALLLAVQPNGPGTVTLKVTVKTATFDITDEATAAVNVPAPGPAPAPSPPVVGAPPVGASPPVGGGNRAPVAQSAQLIAKAGSVTPVALAASDPDANALTFVLVQLPAHGKLSGQAPNLSYTPDGGFLGSDALIFTATDGTASSGQATVAITVTGATVSNAKVAKKTVRKVVRKAVKKPTTKTVKKR